MNSTKRSAYLTAVGIGTVAGMRTLSAPAWVNTHAHSRSMRVLQSLAVIEMIADKLPSNPNRTTPLQFGARVCSGAMSAAYAFKGTTKKVQFLFAAVGGASAAIATYLLFIGRKKIGELTGIKDPLIGLAEDALSFKVGSLLKK